MITVGAVLYGSTPWQHAHLLGTGQFQKAMLMPLCKIGPACASNAGSFTTATMQNMAGSCACMERLPCLPVGMAVVH